MHPNKMSYIKFQKAAVICIVCSFIGIFSVSEAMGDIYWESVQVIKNSKGRPGRKKIIRFYLNDHCSRMDIGEHVMIADFSTMTGYVLNTADRMYLEMKMSTVGRIPAELKEEIRVKPTDASKEIMGYACRKYKVTHMKRTYDQWISQDVDGYKELKTLNDRLRALVKKNPLFQMGIIGRMDKLDGFPVQKIMPMDKGRTKVVTLKRVIVKDLDPSVFSVPKGYKASYE